MNETNSSLVVHVESWLIIPDLHYPFHDQAFVSLTEKLVKRIKPTGIVQLGDALDFFQISAYDKNPARTNDVFDDLQLYNDQLSRWCRYMPKGSRFYQLEGNHEDRLRRFIWRQAAELKQMVKSVPDVLNFKERNNSGHVEFKWFPMANWRACRIGDVYLHHGYIFSKHVAVSCLDRYHANLITGHTHRFQFASNGVNWAATLGHGSNENQTAHSPAPTHWVQCLAVLTVDQGKKSHLEPIFIKDGSCVFRGELVQA